MSLIVLKEIAIRINLAVYFDILMYSLVSRKETGPSVRT